MNDLVKYQNKLNGLPLRTFEDSEMNILFSIIAQVRDKDLKEVTFTFDELREQCRYRPKSNITIQDFVKALQVTKTKLKALDYEEITNGGLDIVDKSLFIGFEILGTQEKLVVQVHPDFKDIFNNSFSFVNRCDYCSSSIINLSNSEYKSNFVGGYHINFPSFFFFNISKRILLVRSITNKLFCFVFVILYSMKSVEFLFILK